MARDLAPMVFVDGVGARAWQEGPAGAHCKCHLRDLEREKELGLNRYCCRCQTSTWQPRGWTHPASPRAAVAPGATKTPKPRRARRAPRDTAGGLGGPTVAPGATAAGRAKAARRSCT